MKITVKELKIRLTKGPTTFKFKKMDGTMREMTATTNPKWFPDGWDLEQTSNTCTTVFDMDENGWRRISNNTEVYL